MWNAGLNDSQAAIKTAERNTNNFRYADDTTLMAESEEKLKSFLMRVKEEREKSSLKYNIQKTTIEDYCDGPVFKTLPSNCWVLNSWLGR